MCNYKIDSSTFNDNYASKMGGCIFYDKYKPQLTNTTFDSLNYAPYGPSIAGIPYGIRVVDYTEYPLASGQMYEGKITVEVIDADF